MVFLLLLPVAVLDAIPQVFLFCSVDAVEMPSIADLELQGTLDADFSPALSTRCSYGKMSLIDTLKIWCFTAILLLLTSFTANQHTQAIQQQIFSMQTTCCNHRNPSLIRTYHPTFSNVVSYVITIKHFNYFACISKLICFHHSYVNEHSIELIHGDRFVGLDNRHLVLSE
ncbi:hypothetical protein GQ55_7G305000 [Panicum hallii var. hallii]|uniref:Uncharacterized protein n=1 Tax=Panicum hallii var. hallii TaxID=1504633 RepID=A0A2T7D0R1_9POAL|nr:hypothetical protein GQ55_7G305000 [Panicum hallii var. hallii]